MLTITEMTKLPSGTPITVTWLFGDAAYGRADASYDADLMCVDWMGTATFRRLEDDFLGIAGSGAWQPTR